MKTLIALLGTTVFVCGSQVVRSDQAPLPPTTASNSYNGNYRGLMGACCLPDGSCVMEYATQCYSSWGGAYMGGDCADNPCDAFIGACCLDSGSCEVVSLADCVDISGNFMGGGLDCSDVSCELQQFSACCYGDDECEVMDSMKCNSLGGTSHYMLSCEQVSCPIPCPPPAESMFSSIAYPLSSVECGVEPDWHWVTPDQIHGAMRIDLDGDHIEEYINDYSSYRTDKGIAEDNHGSIIQMGATSGTIKMTELIDLNPSSIVYTGMLFSCEDISCNLQGFFDVTGDGLPDAIVMVKSMGSAYCYVSDVYYVENISTPPAAACASDLNSDGSVEVNDLMQIISDWGPCE